VDDMQDRQPGIERVGQVRGDYRGSAGGARVSE